MKLKTFLFKNDYKNWLWHFLKNESLNPEQKINVKKKFGFPVPSCSSNFFTFNEAGLWAVRKGLGVFHKTRKREEVVPASLLAGN